MIDTIPPTALSLDVHPKSSPVSASPPTPDSRTAPSRPQVVVAIPARYASTRLPGKPLPILGSLRWSRIEEALAGAALQLDAPTWFYLAEAARGIKAP